MARKRTDIVDPPELPPQWGQVKGDDLSLVFMLPWAPSVNSYWRHTRTGHTYLSPRGRAYRETVWLIAHCRKPMIGPLILTAHFYPPDAIVRDLDNLQKALWDSLKYAGVFADDSQIKEAHLYMDGMLPDGGAVRVEIRPRESRP